MIAAQPPKRGGNVGRNLVFGALVVAAGAGGYLIHNPSQNGVAGASQTGAGAGQGSFSQGGSGRQGGRSGGRNAIIPVQAVTVKASSLAANRNSAGTVVPVMVSQVAAQASGTASKILVKVGDSVQAGQAVVQLDTTQLALTAQNAQLALENAQINLKSQDTNTVQATQKLEQQVSAAQSALDAANRTYVSDQKVYAVGGISKTDLENAKTALETAQGNLSNAQDSLSQNQRAGGEGLAQLKLAISQAQIQLSQAKLNLANATLKAPFSGQITAINAVPGQAVTPGAAAFSLSSASREVKFSVPPADAIAFVPGRIYRFDAGNGHFQVKVDERPAAPVTQNVPLIARVIDASAPASGVVGIVNYSVNLAKGTIVPISSLQSDGTRTFVFTIQAGQVKSLTATVLAQAGSDAAVSGVPAGAQVILNPPPGLLEGAKVTTDLTQTSFGTRGGQNGAAGGSGQGGTQQNTPGSSAPSIPSGGAGKWKGNTQGGATPPGNNSSVDGQNGTPGQAATPAGANNSATPADANNAAPSQGAATGADGTTPVKHHHKKPAAIGADPTGSSSTPPTTQPATQPAGQTGGGN